MEVLSLSLCLSVSLFTEDWTQGLAHTRQTLYHLNHAPSLKRYIFLYNIQITYF
jgi:hypothetical protein